MGSSHQGFYPTFQKKQKDEFICVKLVTILILCNEKVPLIDFFGKDINKSLPFY